MKRPALMAIVNCTPDSFSGDGVGVAEAIARAAHAANDGASIIDIGAESTRPGATPLTADAEWARLEPLLVGMRNAPWRQQVRLSIDTRHAFTAAKALAHGVDIINDVSGLRDAAMMRGLAAANCDVVVMHALDIPADPANILPADCDVVETILAWKRTISARAEEAGIAPERLIFDAGIGFGKSAAQSLALIMGAGHLKQSGGRWLFGHSRKSFLTLFTDAPAPARDELTLAFSAMLTGAGVDYLRVHNVVRHRALLDALCT